MYSFFAVAFFLFFTWQSYQVSKAPGPMQAENSRRCQQIVQVVLPMLMLRMNKEFNLEVAAVSVEAIDAMVNDLGESTPCTRCTRASLNNAITASTTTTTTNSTNSRNTFFWMALILVFLFLGPGCVESVLDSLVQQLLLFLEGKAMCQQINDDGDDDEGGFEEEDEEDHDFILMDSVTDLIGTLARAFGTRFLNYAQPLLQPLGRFLAPNRLHTDRSMAIGCYAELVQGIGAGGMGGECNLLLWWWWFVVVVVCGC